MWFTFEDALKIVKARGQFMQAAAEAEPSTMLVLMGADEPTANAICDEARQDDILVPANFNSPGQIVLSGAIAACERATTVAQTKGVRAMPLKVAGAFHSPFMQSAADQMAQVLAGVRFCLPKMPVISNVTAQPHESVESIRQLLVQQIIAPVRWQQSMETLRAAGVDKWIEVGPGRSLTGMLKKIDRKAAVENFSATDGLAKGMETNKISGTV